MEEMPRASNWERAWNFYALFIVLCSLVSLYCSSTQNLWEPCPPGIFMESPLHTHDWLLKSLDIGNQLKLLPLTPSLKVWVEVKSSNSLIARLVPLTTSSHSWVGANGHLINVTKDT